MFIKFAVGIYYSWQQTITPQVFVVEDAFILSPCIQKLYISHQELEVEK